MSGRISDPAVYARAMAAWWREERKNHPSAPPEVVKAASAAHRAVGGPHGTADEIAERWDRTAFALMTDQVFEEIQR